MVSGNFKKRVLRAVPAAVLVLSLPVISPALAADDVLATVNGHKIMASELKFANEELKSQLSKIPQDKQKSLLTNYLIDRALIVAAARAEKLDAKPGFAARLAYYQDRAYRDAYFGKVMAVTDEEVKAFYDKQLKMVPPREEIRARHILVKTEDEAKAIIKELEGGKDFAELAKEKSTGPSKTRGGDLGYFAKGDMVPVFFTAADALKKGEFSKPVKSRFGWHVIKQEDRRVSKPPAIDTVSDQINKLLKRQKAELLIRRLRKDAKIEIVAEKKAAEALAAKAKAAVAATDSKPAKDSKPASDASKEMKTK